ncbi:MAG: MFS transporter [Candidatus Cloacimonadota bacterium]|nr:MAG: MFS transporter [Candidatus Cloacimonadota bacterium]
MNNKDKKKSPNRGIKFSQEDKEIFKTSYVALISGAHLLHDIFTSFLPPMLPLLIETHGISMFQAGLLDTVRKIPSLFNPLVGLLADKICLRYLVIFSPLLSALGMCLLGIAPSFGQMIFLLSLVGISNTMFHVPAPVMIKQVSGNRVGKGMSFFMLGGEISRTLGPILITGVISLRGLKGAVSIIPVGALATFFLWIKLRNFHMVSPADKSDKIKLTGTIKKIMPAMISVSGIMFFRTAMKISLTLYLPAYMTGKGNSIFLAGSSLAVLQFAGAFGTFAAGSVSDKIGRKKTLISASVLTPILMTAFLYADGVLKISVLILLGFFLFSFGPVLMAFVQDTDTEHPAFANGVYMMINFGISSLMSLLIGLGGDKIGLETTFKTAILLSLGSIPFVLTIKEKRC